MHKKCNKEKSENTVTQRKVDIKKKDTEIKGKYIY